MKNHSNTRRKHRSLAPLYYTLGSIAAAATIAGAIYFVVKNGRRVSKQYWSIEKFLQISKNIKLDPVVINSASAKEIYENFIHEKQKVDALRNKYINQHPELKPYLNNNTRTAFDFKFKGPKKSEIKKLLKDMPEEFDAHNFIFSKILTNQTFTEMKFLKMRFSNLELDTSDKESNKLKVTYEVYLNYEYATGSFELNNVKGTSQSKYYFKGNQTVKVISDSEKWNLNSKFANNLEKNLDDARKIIRIGIVKNDPKWTQSNEFREMIFKWFKRIFIENDAFPDTYGKDEYEIMPFNETSSGDDYVRWNPKKGLNNLTIKFFYVNKKNPDIKSPGRIKIFTILKV